MESCKIIRTGDAVTVLDNFGRPSKLYEQALERTTNTDEALSIWAVTQTEGWVEMFGENKEADVNEVLRYLSIMDNQVTLDKGELQEVQMIMKDLGLDSIFAFTNKMNKLFQPNGYFEIDVDRLINSGLYSQDDIDNLNGVELKKLLSKLNNYNIDFEIIDNNDKILPLVANFRDVRAKRTIFGTKPMINEQDIIKIVAEQTGGDFSKKSIIKALASTEFSALIDSKSTVDSLVKHLAGKRLIVNQFFNGTEYTSDNLTTFTTVKNTILENVDTVEIEESLDFVKSIDVEIWDNNKETVKQLLKELTEDLAKSNIDIVGIENVVGDKQAIENLLESIQTMLENPTQENILTFSQLKDSLIKPESNVTVEQVNSRFDGLNVVRINSELSDSELFENSGLIKIDNTGLYHKVSRATKEELYDTIYEGYVNNTINIDPKYFETEFPKDLENQDSTREGIRTFIQSRDIGFNSPLAEEISLNQVAFGHPNLKADGLIAQPSENADYLKQGFVSDFYNYQIREKIANSPLYNKVLKYFSITDNDITLNNLDVRIGDTKYETELREYANIKKNGLIKNLAEFDNNVDEDLKALNNPKSVNTAQGVSMIKDGAYLVTSPNADLYTKVGDKVYRKLLDSLEGTVYGEVRIEPDNIYFDTNTNFSFNEAEARAVLNRNTKNIEPKLAEESKELKDKIHVDNVIEAVESEVATELEKMLIDDVNNGVGTTQDLETNTDEVYNKATQYTEFEDFVESMSDFRDSHSAPSKDERNTEEKLKEGGDFSLQEVASGFHNQPNDYFDTKVGARYYGYDNLEGRESLTAINNIQRALKAGRSDLKVTAYRAIPNNIDVKEMKDYDWVSLSKTYAVNHGEHRFGEGEYKIIEQEIPITDLWWDGNDINEWGYDTGNTKHYSRRELQSIWGEAQKIKSATENTGQEIKAIKDQAIADGTFMKAPNGRDSNLSEEQWVTVRTERFKKWFGDWQNDPQNASKVVDENGEPMVVYHYSPNEFNEFDNNVKGNNTGYPNANLGFFFGTKEGVEELLKDNEGTFGENQYAVFLNIKRPIDIRMSAWFNNAETASFIYEKATGEKPNNPQEALDFIESEIGLGEVDDIVELFNNSTDDILSIGFDGYLSDMGNNNVEYIASNSNQIKSATENVGQFSNENNDIRYQIISEKGASQVLEYKESLDEAKKLHSQGVPLSEIENKTKWYLFKDNWRRMSPEAIQDFKIKDSTVNKVLTLKDVLGNENVLFNFYPQLRETKVVFADTNLQNVPVQTPKDFEKSNGLFHEDSNTIVINTRNAKTQSQQEYTLSHEVVHNIQKLEGLPKGGGLTSVLSETLDILNLEGNKPLPQIYQEIISADKSKLTINEKKIVQASIDTVSDLVLGRAGNLQSQYLHLMGEIDANIVEGAMNIRDNSGFIETSYSSLLNFYNESTNIDPNNILLLRNGNVRFNINESNKKATQRNNVGYQIISEKGAQRIKKYKDLLDKAKELEKNNVSLSDITDQTGWFKYKGDWRFFSNEALEQFKINEDAIKVNTEQKLSDILSTDNILFDMYPTLGEVKVVVSQDTNLPKNASYNEGGKIIKTNLFKGRELTSAIAHEVAHFIQQREGLPQGGNYNLLLQQLVSELNFIPKNTQLTLSQLKDLLEVNKTEDNKSTVEAVLSLVDNNTDEVKYKIYRAIMGEMDAHMVTKAYTNRETPYTYLELLDEELIEQKLSDTSVIVIGNQGDVTFTPKVKTTQKETVKEVINKLKETGLAEKVFELTSAEMEAKLVEIGLENVVQNPNGFTYKNEVYLNTDSMTEDTPIHEFNHLYTKWLKEARPDIYNRGLELARKEIEKGGVSVGENMESNELPSIDNILDIVEDEGLIGEDERFETKEEALEYANEIHSILSEYYDMVDIPVYRAVKADEVDLDPYSIGESWSFSLQSAKEFAMQNNMGNKIISGFVRNSNVEWESAVKLFIQFSDIFDGASEFELPIPAGNRIDNVKVEDIKSAKERVQETSEIQDIIDFVKTNQPNLKGEALHEEILTELVGRRGVEIIEENKDTAITNWLKDVWDKIKGMLGLSQYSVSQVSKMSLGEYSRAMAVDLLSGNLFEGKNGEANYQRWKGENKEVSGEEVQKVKTGEPIVVKGFHGTTNEFYEFDASVKGNIEGHLGKVNYFTSDYQDASQNYLAEGADITGRIDRRQDELEGTLRYDYQSSEEGLDFQRIIEDFNITDEEVENLYPSGKPEIIQAEEISRFLAEKEIKGETEQILDVFIKLNNPVVLGNGATWFEALDIDEVYMQEATEEITEEYGITEDEAKEEYEYEIRNRAVEKQGDGNRIASALEQALDDNGYDQAQVFDILGDNYYETEVDLNKLEESIRNSELYDNYNGELASSQVIADFFKNLGFDGIILTDVSQRFSGMRLSTSTSHIHVFDEYNNQIKLSDGTNSTFGETKDVRFQNSENKAVISQQTINSKVNTYQSANDIGLEIVNLYPQSKSKDIQKEFNECAI